MSRTPELPNSRTPELPNSRTTWFGRAILAIVLLVLTPMHAFAQTGIHDWDADGVDDTFLDIPKANHHQLKIWFSSAGAATGRSPDVIVTERYADQTAFFTRITAYPDIDGDGIREIVTLGAVANPATGGSVTVMSVYSSRNGSSSISYYGTGTELLLSVFEGRATGNLTDELLAQIGEETEVTAGFILDRLPAVVFDGPHRADSSDSYEWNHFQTTRIVLRLWSLDPYSWGWKIGRFNEITSIALKKSNDRYPNDADKRNALRHALWQFLMSCQLGSDIAQGIGDIHEDYSSDPCDSAIDQFNNNAARQMATPGACGNFDGDTIDPTNIETLTNDLMQAIEDGVFVVSPNDPRVSGACQS